MPAPFSVHSLGLTDVCMCMHAYTRVRMCACVKAGKTEADQILLDMDFRQQVQIEGGFYIVPSE